MEREQPGGNDTKTLRKCKIPVSPRSWELASLLMEEARPTQILNRTHMRQSCRSICIRTLLLDKQWLLLGPSLVVVGQIMSTSQEVNSKSWFDFYQFYSSFQLYGGVSKPLAIYPLPNMEKHSQKLKNYTGHD